MHQNFLSTRNFEFTSLIDFFVTFKAKGLAFEGYETEQGYVWLLLRFSILMELNKTERCYVFSFVEYAFIIEKSSQCSWLTSTYNKCTAQKVSFPLAANVFDNIKKNFHWFTVWTHKRSFLHGGMPPPLPPRGVKAITTISIRKVNKREYLPMYIEQSFLHVLCFHPEHFRPEFCPAFQSRSAGKKNS